MKNIEIIASGLKKTPFIVNKGGYIDTAVGKVYMHKYFLFDNGSLPKICKFLYDTFKVKFFNYYSKAFLCHDFLYKHHGYMTSPRYVITPITRIEADNIMVDLMIQDGYTPKQCEVFFLAVRFFGWWGWYFKR